MSDTMLLGILRMPFDLALSTPTAQIQYYQRGVQAADEIEKLHAENEKLQRSFDDGYQMLEATQQANDKLRSDNELLREENEKLRAEIWRLRAENERLRNVNAMRLYKEFGR